MRGGHKQQGKVDPQTLVYIIAICYFGALALIAYTIGSGWTAFLIAIPLLGILCWAVETLPSSGERTFSTIDDEKKRSGSGHRGRKYKRYSNEQQPT